MILHQKILPRNNSSLGVTRPCLPRVGWLISVSQPWDRSSRITPLPLLNTRGRPHIHLSPCAKSVVHPGSSTILHISHLFTCTPSLTSLQSTNSYPQLSQTGQDFIGLWKEASVKGLINFKGKSEYRQNALCRYKVSINSQSLEDTQVG